MTEAPEDPIVFQVALTAEDRARGRVSVGNGNAWADTDPEQLRRLRANDSVVIASQFEHYEAAVVHHVQALIGEDGEAVMWFYELAFGPGL